MRQSTSLIRSARIRYAWLAGILLFPIACDKPAATGWSSLDAASLSTSQQQQRKTAEAGKQAMYTRLLGALMAELGSSGPAGAIGVCRDKAPAIAKAVGEENGIRIGRTSWKLRNHANRPPDWAQSFIERRPSEPVYLAHKDGRFAALLPIRVSPPCLLCHGQEAQLAPGVKEALAASYPSDNATGFNDGDLRGWFWVEVPATK